MGLEVVLCGDAHLANYGAFATPERRLVFDINDFDEAYPGPWEWDLKRLAASAVVAGREKGRRIITLVSKYIDGRGQHRVVFGVSTARGNSCRHH
jgi:uncharacterized protein (DUF2252 family)